MSAVERSGYSAALQAEIAALRARDTGPGPCLKCSGSGVFWIASRRPGVPHKRAVCFPCSGSGVMDLEARIRDLVYWWHNCPRP